MGLKGHLRRIQKLARGEMIEIPQNDGTVAYFHQYELLDAFANLVDRMHAPEGELPEEHPLLIAARSSSDAKWAQSIYSSTDEMFTADLENLSES